MLAYHSQCAAGAAAPAARFAGPRPRAAARRGVSAAASSSNSEAACPAATQQEGSTTQLARRQLLSLALLPPAAAALLSAAGPAAAEEGAAAVAAPAAAPSSFTFTDEEDKFSITVPAGWEQGIGAIGEAGTLTSQQSRFSNAAGLRRVVAFVPPGKPEVSVAITIQYIAPDFTAMGSFGTATDFATGVVNKMDNSYILRLPEWRRAREGPVQVAKLLDAREVQRGAKQYVFSYSLAKEGEPARTVFQSVAIGNTGRYNKLFTLNATCTAADLEQYGPVLKGIVDSFRPPAALAI
ncbi:psbP domain-containing chloroplastic [Chlorella sorokiniana]|uniref:PsbP domain-containing chloroplastic n=1 Tax=Chlorella sorokiniana TaxID=3076 RepID=A0A2P6TXN8_CHLSO|nr:psbP domain-containing chloroplastic [Chlorella sorokiniana]|eukprot:PRW58834.1 psbP domain-containing chloroplastic [Chlorella sorokiniana]